LQILWKKVTENANFWTTSKRKEIYRDMY